MLLGAVPLRCHCGCDWISKGERVPAWAGATFDISVELCFTSHLQFSQAKRCLQCLITFTHGDLQTLVLYNLEKIQDESSVWASGRQQQQVSAEFQETQKYEEQLQKDFFSLPGPARVSQHILLIVLNFNNLSCVCATTVRVAFKNGNVLYRSQQWTKVQTAS